MVTSLREFALQVLEGGELATKLSNPRTTGGALLPDEAPGPAVFIDRPARAERIQLSTQSSKLPKVGRLQDPEARAICLDRFAHHELMAVELFAWALLAFPQAPPALRRGLAIALEEEQTHLGLYLDRLHAHGGGFGDRPLHGYFWHVLPTDDEATLPGFLAGQGLTLEQANLDFTVLYRDGFRTAGDVESANVMQRVHDDEIGHVQLAHIWFQRLVSPKTVCEAYPDEVPFPLSAARAKGRRFQRQARVAAGLDDGFIDFVEQARPYN